MYHKQAINLADELTTFVTSETMTDPSVSSLGPNKEKINDSFCYLLADLFLCEDLHLHAGASLKEDLNLDSLDLVELVMNCEREYGIMLQDHEWTGLQTIGEWLSLLYDKTKDTVQD